MASSDTLAKRAVHAAFLKAGLKLDGESPKHEAIIQKIVG